MMIEGAGRHDLAAHHSAPVTRQRLARDTFPVAVIVLIVLVVWYLAAIPMNGVLSQPLIDAAGGGFMNTLPISWSLPRPVLPSPHQVIAELWNTVFTTAPWRPRSLLYHCWDGPHRVVEADARVPQRVPELLGDLLDPAGALALVHEDQVEVRERHELAPAEPADGDQCDPRRVRADAGLRGVHGQPELVQVGQGLPQHVRPESAGLVRRAPAEQPVTRQHQVGSSGGGLALGGRPLPLVVIRARRCRALRCAP